ncbi:hypothetical protein V6N13_087994 [Hibiscus sabdariffa]
MEGYEDEVWGKRASLFPIQVKRKEKKIFKFIDGSNPSFKGSSDPIEAAVPSADYRIKEKCLRRSLKLATRTQCMMWPWIIMHLATLTGHQGPVWQVAWAHPKFGSLLASCCYDGRVIIWKEGNQNEWSQAHVFDDHKSSVNSIAWAPHELGLCLACGSSDGNISVFTARADGGWDVSRIDQAHPVGVTSVSWAPSTAPGALVGSGLLDPVQKLCSGGCDSTVKVWKLYNGIWKMDCFPALQMHTDWVRDVAWAPNLGLPKSTVASASQDGKVIIWTVAKEGDQWEGKVLHDFGTPVWRVSWSLTGNILAVADGNNNVTLWKEAVDGEWQQVTVVEP